MRLSWVHATLCFYSATALLVCGCGPNTDRLYPVHGIVAFKDGPPVRGGTIEFMSVEGGRSAIGQIASDGKFKLTTIDDGDGTVAGNHKVIVLQGGVPIGGGEIHHHGPAVPARYGKYETSGLTAQVHADRKNDLRVELAVR